MWEILLGFGIPEVGIFIIQAVSSYAMVYYAYDCGLSPTKHFGKVLLILILLVLQGITGFSMGLTLGVICSQEAVASIIMLAFIFPNMLLSGMFWPREGMPIVLQAVSKVLPMTLPGETARAIMTRGWNFGHSHVWPGFAVTLAWISGTTLLTLGIIHFQSRNR